MCRDLYFAMFGKFQKTKRSAHLNKSWNRTETLICDTRIGFQSITGRLRRLTNLQYVLLWKLSLWKNLLPIFCCLIRCQDNSLLLLIQCWTQNTNRFINEPNYYILTISLWTEVWVWPPDRILKLTSQFLFPRLYKASYMNATFL